MSRKREVTGEAIHHSHKQQNKQQAMTTLQEMAVFNSLHGSFVA